MERSTLKLDCYLIDRGDLDIRPASNRRSWMDATNGFDYRCLPLSIANAHGWVIGCDGSFEVEWNGGDAPGDVRVFPLDDEPARAKGNFGSGILTLQPHVIFRAESGYNLWVTGPPNSFKDGIQPLSAVVEKDWIPASFTMNWKITRPNHRIRFEKGEPYCFVFPIKRGLAEATQPTLKHLGENPELKHDYNYARNMCNFVDQVKSLRQKEGKSDEIEKEKVLRFQKWYMSGEMPDGARTFDARP
jgi:hypothetical protein